jgi:hypothetical protein
MASSRTAPAPSRTPRRSTTTALEGWRERALTVPGEVLSSSLPLRILLDEAAIAATFSRRRWRSTAAHPGLESAVNETFTADTGRELAELRSAVDEADVAYRAIPARPPGVAAEARRILRAITATLAWHLDGGDDARGRAQLDALRAGHPKVGRSAAALATALEDSARLAESYRSAITGLGGFDPRELDAALILARALRERSRAPREQPAARREALALRNKLVALLRDRLATVRAAARFVFRDHPEIIREVTSEHERTRRREGRGATSRSSSPGAKQSTDRP